jgi:hypothetical protein
MSDTLSLAGAPEAANAREQGAPRLEAGGRPKFDNDAGFQTEVRRRVEEFFRAPGAGSETARGCT